MSNRPPESDPNMVWVADLAAQMARRLRRCLLPVLRGSLEAAIDGITGEAFEQQLGSCC